MTIRQALNQSPESELLLGAVLKQSNEFLYLHPEKPLTQAQERRFSNFTKSQQAGMPIAYILGYKDFYGLRFKVNRSTLIPRPESEWLVERSLAILKGRPFPKVIDIGTGSGCLAISLKVHFPAAQLTATDLSKSALKVAQHNADSHQVKITFKEQDLLYGDTTNYDLILANLPYVPKSDYRKFHDNLKYEPKLALIDRSEDFTLYETLLKQLQATAKPQATALLEIDPTMKTQITSWQKKNWPTAKLKFIKDLNRLWRFCEITSPAHSP